MKSAEGLQWLKWAREIKAIAQTGTHYTRDDFDRIRFRRLLEIATEMFSKSTNMPAEVFEKIFMSERGYATPKVDVRAAVFRDGRILMVRERSDGCWSMPGGWADVNEAPSSMIEREVMEESGFHVKAARVVGVYEANHDREPVAVYHAYRLVFLCDLIDGVATPSNETSAVEFFRLDEIPPLSAIRMQMRYVEEAFAHHHDPHRAVAID